MLQCNALNDEWAKWAEEAQWQTGYFGVGSLLVRSIVKARRFHFLGPLAPPPPHSSACPRSLACCPLARTPRRPPPHTPRDARHRPRTTSRSRRRASRSARRRPRRSSPSATRPTSSRSAASRRRPRRRRPPPATSGCANGRNELAARGQCTTSFACRRRSCLARACAREKAGQHCGQMYA